jgi:phage-related protein (TIGR01555 family)
MAKALRAKAVEAARRIKLADGWTNVITGLGTSKDKNTYSEVDWVPTTRSCADGLYGGDEMGAKIARIIPYDGTREGVTWNMDQSSNQDEVIKFIETEFKRLNLWETMAWAWTLARVYGGSCIFISVDDGRQLHRPLDLSKVRRVNTLNVLDRWELNVRSTEIIADIRSPSFGLPEFYHYNTSEGPVSGGETVVIHHSRMIRFDGIPLPTRLWKRNGYWDDSVYSALGTAIRNYSTTHDNISTIIADFNQPVYRIEGLSEALAQDEDELIVKKLQTVNLMRSAARAIVLDKEDEFENVSTNVAGGRDLVDLTVQRLVAGTDVPHTRLLGNSPTGLGATGQAELINYYDSVKSMQALTLRNPLEEMTELLFSQSQNPMEKPKDLAFHFNPLFQQNQEDEIKTREMQANSDEKYINLGVYTPQEVSDSRFGTGRYSFETILQEGIVREIPEPPTPPGGGDSGIGAL